VKVGVGATKSTATQNKGAASGGTMVEKAPEATSVQEELKASAGEATAPMAPDQWMGRPAEEWWIWLANSADTTIVQTYKLAELQRIATFLGIEAEGLTKLDIISNFRTALEGRKE
jgi:hypothetical protein